MRKITARIVHFFIESKVIDETDQEIYEYGLEILSENVMLTVFLLLFGVMIGKGIETCIFLFSFCWFWGFCVSPSQSSCIWLFITIHWERN